MVASKSNKTTKHSYAERVLGAFTTVQKEHRRHVVHIATLRAQVKKTAQAKQDKLGPQWSNWVGKAVHKLEDEGILASGEPSGSLTLTPIGKKAISTARELLSIPQHTTPTPVEEDLIWKQVTQPSHSISRGTKRSRRSSALRPRENGRMDGEPSYTASTRSKRPRISTPTEPRVHKPNANMRKTELQANKKAHEEAIWRETSPLTDLDEDDAKDITHLKERLEQQEGEISELRRALAESKRQAHRSEPQSDRFPRLEIDATPLPARTLHGVTRTQSGSFISTLSKQPTPEPSTPGPIDDRAFDMTYGPEGGNIAIQEYDHRSSVIPVDDMGDHDAQVSVHKMTELEHSLAARVLDVRKLEDQLLELQIECSTAVQKLSQSDARIKALQTEILTVENEASELRATKNDLEASLTSRVTERNRTIQERDASIAALESEKEKYVMELAGLQSTLSQAIASHVAQALIAENEAKALRSAVEATEVSNAALTEKQKATDADLQASVNQLQQTIDELEAYKEKTKEKVTQLSMESASIAGRLQTAEASNEHFSNQLSAAADELSEFLAQAQEEADSLRKEVSVTKLRISTLDKDLGISKRTAEDLIAQLAASMEERADLAVQLEHSKQTIRDITSSFGETEKRLATVESAAEKFQAEAKAHEVEAQDLRTQLTTAQIQASTTAEQLSTAQMNHAQEFAKQASTILNLEQQLESTRAELQSQLEKQGTQLVETKLSLEAEQKRSSDLEEQLRSAVSRIQEAEEELSDIEESKEADERTIQNLKEMFSTLRETQMRSLAELDNEVVSAHSSPARKRGSTRKAGKA